MKTRVEFAKEHIERQIAWAEEELKKDRKNVIRAAENSDADSVIAWAQNMKRTEDRIHELKSQLEVVTFITNE